MVPYLQATKLQELAVARIALLVLSLLSVGAWAQPGIDIYRVEAAVASQLEAERIAVTKANLGEVITRVTGDSAALQHPLVRQAINDAPNYLAKFSYPSEKTIILNYSSQAIQTLLQQAQLVSVTANTAHSTKLYVTEVKDFAAFKQIQAYLKTVGLIRNVNLHSVEKDVLQFNLSLDGDEQMLKTTLAAGGRLQWVAGDEQKPLTFRWQN
jgi:hypothetical protein